MLKRKVKIENKSKHLLIIMSAFLFFIAIRYLLLSIMIYMKKISKNKIVFSYFLKKYLLKKKNQSLI